MAGEITVIHDRRVTVDHDRKEWQEATEDMIKGCDRTYDSSP